VALKDSTRSGVGIFKGSNHFYKYVMPPASRWQSQLVSFFTGKTIPDFRDRLSGGFLATQSL
jgi:hypothetical protein